MVGEVWTASLVRLDVFVRENTLKVRQSSE